MPKLRGTALLEAKGSGTKSSGGRKAGAFTPLFSLKEGETTYIKFLRDDDLEEVFLHTWVRVPPTSNRGKERGYDWEVFASRTRNEQFDESYSLLEKELDHWPAKKIAGIVLQLEPEYDGKGEAFKNLTGFKVAGNTVARDDKEDIFYPRWQLVFEARGTFWGNLVQIHNAMGLTSFPLQVTRTSDGYQFLAVTNIKNEIDWDQYKDWVPTVKDEIARLGSEERYEEYFGEGKPRIENQQQRHIWLADWIQKERQETLGLSDEEVAEENQGEGWSDPTEENTTTPEPAPKKRKSRVSFEEIEKLAETRDKTGVTPY